MAYEDDFDNFTGFWIKGVPYLWVPGDSPQTSMRFYILHHNASSVFDSNDYILDPTFVKNALFAHRLDPKETFSLFPIAHKKDCGIVRNHFLVWMFSDVEKGDTSLKMTKYTIKYISKGEKRDMEEKYIPFPWTSVSDIRIEGRRIDSIPHHPPRFDDNMVDIVNPSTSYEAKVSSYPWEFGNPHVSSQGGVRAEIIVQTAGRKPRMFLNILKAVEEFKLTIGDVKRIHPEALKNAYVSASTQGRRDDQRTVDAIRSLTHELERIGEPIPQIKDWDPDRGWKYDWKYMSIGAIRILYDTAIGKRKEYIFRDPGGYGKELEPGVISELPPAVVTAEDIASFYKPKVAPAEQVVSHKTPEKPGHFSPVVSPVYVPGSPGYLPQGKPKGKPIISRSVVLDKYVMMYTTADLKKRNIRKMGDELVCFDDEPNKKYRASMEDEALQARLGPRVWLYAVLDGHGGSKASKHFAKVIPAAILSELQKIPPEFKIEDVTEAVTKAFISEDSKWFHTGDWKDNISGTTFTGVLVTPHYFYTINLGDSRTLLHQGKTLYFTRDHKPEDAIEEARIIDAGSFVSSDGRVEANLAVSRALGDNEFKVSRSTNKYLGAKSPVSPVPDVEPFARKGGELILIACDGVFDVMTSEEAMRTFLVNKSCEDIVRKAIKLGTTDNITVMGISIPK